MEEIIIAFVGDGTLQGTALLSKEEQKVLKKVLDALEADGPFAPRVCLRNLTLERRAKQKAEQQRRQANQKRRRALTDDQRHIGRYCIGDKLRAAMLAAGWIA